MTQLVDNFHTGFILIQFKLIIRYYNHVKLRFKLFKRAKIVTLSVGLFLLKQLHENKQGVGRLVAAVAYRYPESSLRTWSILCLHFPARRITKALKK